MDYCRDCEKKIIYVFFSENQKKNLCSQEITENIKLFVEKKDAGDKVKYWNEAVKVADEKFASIRFSENIEEIIGIGQQSLLMWKTAHLYKYTTKEANALEIDETKNKYYENTLNVMTYLKYAFGNKKITNKQHTLATYEFVCDAFAFDKKSEEATEENVSEEIKSFLNRKQEQPKKFMSNEFYKILQSSFLWCSTEALTLVSMLYELSKDKDDVIKIIRKIKLDNDGKRSDHVMLICIYYDIWQATKYSKNKKNLIINKLGKDNFKQFDKFMHRCEQRTRKLMIEMPMFIENSCGRKYSHLYKALAYAYFEKAAKRIKNAKGIDNERYENAKGETVYIHPSSTLYGRQPGKQADFVIYQDIQDLDGKKYMHMITEVKEEWLLNIPTSHESGSNLFNHSDSRPDLFGVTADVVVNEAPYNRPEKRPHDSQSSDAHNVSKMPRCFK